MQKALVQKAHAGDAKGASCKRVMQGLFEDSLRIVPVIPHIGELD
jgi:hypothetical protein